MATEDTSTAALVFWPNADFANANAGHVERVHLNILQGYIPWISLNQTFLSIVKG